jgi:hypothetical protein
VTLRADSCRRAQSAAVALPAFVIALLCFAAPALLSAQTPAPRVAHVFVALADNAHQGIVPVPAKLGNGDDPAANLYWGAAFGVKTFFRASSDWQLIFTERSANPAILERCVFKHRGEAVFLIADAYQGSHIREAVTDFLSAAAGLNRKTFSPGVHASSSAGPIVINDGAADDLVAYVGHDAFMDFQIAPISAEKGTAPRPTIVLACASKSYFASYLRAANADPLLWTTGLMAPEAYTLEAALEGWIAHEDREKVRQRAAEAYDKYQHCGLRAAQRLFTSGW